MHRPRRKRALGLISLLILVPFLTMFLDVTLGIYLLIGGLILSTIVSFGLARDARKQIFQNPEEGYTTLNRAGNIIWVSLEDEHGNPLPEAEAQQKMNNARANAGPMDQVRAKPLKK